MKGIQVVNNGFCLMVEYLNLVMKKFWSTGILEY